MLDILITAVVFVLMISVLVAAHELGHYLLAKLFKMDVEEFAIGFGKRPLWIWMRKKQEGSSDTIFTVRAWPVGGFVRIAGMTPLDDGSEVQVRNGFYSKPPWQRFIVLLAGPVFSVVAGLIVLMSVYSTAGIPKQVAVIGKVTADGIAAKAGLKAKDRIVRVDGQPIKTWSDLQAAVAPKYNKQIEVVVQRDGAEQKFALTPKPTDEPVQLMDEYFQPIGEKKIVGRIGIEPGEREKVKVTFAEATREALLTPVLMAKGLVQAFTSVDRFKDSVGGPVTMVAATSETTKRGVDSVITLAGLLSISLGIFNLLPVPPLDGGQMVIAVWEMLRKGRRLSMKVQERVAAAGFSLVVLLVLSVFAVDIQRWFLTPPPEKDPPAKSAPAPK